MKRSISVKAKTLGNVLLTKKYIIHIDHKTLLDVLMVNFFVNLIKCVIWHN